MTNLNDCYKPNQRTNKKELKCFTQEEYHSLLKSGMMWVLYPEATGNYRIDVIEANLDVSGGESGEDDCHNTFPQNNVKTVGEENMNDEFAQKVSVNWVEEGVTKELSSDVTYVEDFLKLMLTAYKDFGFLNELVVEVKNPLGDCEYSFSPKEDSISDVFGE